MAAAVDPKTLSAELASSREAISSYATALRQDFDIGAKLKRGFRQYPFGWYAAAGLLGLLLSKLPPRRRDVVSKRSPRLHEGPKTAGKAALAMTILKLALDFAKPALLRWIKDRYLKPKRSPGNGMIDPFHLGSRNRSTDCQPR
jgi:hypothetical protein